MSQRGAAWSVLVVLTFVLLPPARAWVSAQQPSLPSILARAAERVAGFTQPTRIIACEERYKQKLEKVRAIVGFDYAGPVGSRSEVEAVGIDAREWIAEVAIVATPANEVVGFPWMEFRDVVSVNGKPVRDGTSRLGVLATDSAVAGGRRAVEISREAADFVFGHLARAIDVPRAALLFLHPQNQPRFEFKKGGQKTIDGVRTVEVKFVEKTKPTIIRASGGKDSPSSGSFWIDPATGHVLMSLLKSADSSTVFDELTVTYREDPATGLWLPAELKERIMDDDAGLRVQATATFTNWRVVPRKTT
jgi:hypothetical protein